MIRFARSSAVAASLALFACEGRGESPHATALATPAPLQAAPSASGAPPILAAPTDPCPDLCAKSAPLACSQAGACAAGCRELRDLPLCRREVLSFFDCLMAEPLEHWECSPEGNASIRDGYCDREQAAAAKCLGGAAP